MWVRKDGGGEVRWDGCLDTVYRGEEGYDVKVNGLVEKEQRVALVSRSGYMGPLIREITISGRFLTYTLRAHFVRHFICVHAPRLQRFAGSVQR